MSEARYCLLPATRDFVDANRGLAHAVARHSRAARHVPEEDRLQECLAALCRAAVLFDPDLGYAFATYACRAMYEAMVRLGRTDRLIHVPERLFRPALAGDSDSTRALRAEAAPVLSVARLSTLGDDEGRPYEPTAPEGRDEAILAEEERRDALREAVRRLPPRVRMVVSERLRGKTYDSIGRALGISKQRACQIEKKGRELLAADLGDRLREVG